MPSIKKDTFGKLSDGREAAIYTLRNIKGNELKITNYGARIVSMRFRNKDFQNKFVLKSYDDVTGYEKDDAAGVVYVDGENEFSKILWDAEPIIEGLKLTAKVGEKSAEILYSLSNDNEISISYKAKGVEDISSQIVFSADVFADSSFSIYDEAKSKGKISGKNVYSIIDEPAVVEMEVGMFGYDPGCPIDWIESGLKNAADIVSEAANIALNIYATQNNLHIEEVDGGFAIKTSGTKSAGGEIKSQTVYVLKNN